MSDASCGVVMEIQHCALLVNFLEIVLFTGKIMRRISGTKVTVSCDIRRALLKVRST